MTNYYTLRVHNAEIKDLWRKRSIFKGRFTRPSPYVKISVGDLVQRSSIAEKTVIPTWDDELPILCSGGEPKINIEILQDSVLAKGEYLYRPDNENERSGVKLRVDLRSHKDKIMKSSSFIMFGINPSDANGIAELAIKKLIQAVYGNNDEASTVDEMIQRGAAGYQSDLASLFKESTPFVDVFMKNMDELAGAHPYLKLAWNITSMAYKAVHSQIEFDKQVKELIEELVRTFRVIRDAAQIRRPLESFTAATSELLDLVIRLCIFIREYVRRDFIGRTLHVNDREVITEFRAKLGTLKTNLDEAFSRQNVVFSSRAADDALRKGLEHDLNPVDMFGGDRPGCLDGTRVSLLQEIERWIHDKNQPNIFLLTGGAGTGKSTVATTITERYRYRRQLGCHLSFMRGKSDPESVIRTMAYRLASLNQTIAENIDDSVKAHGEIKSATMMSQFKILLHGPLHSSAQTESDYPILVVLDALDECGTEKDRKSLLHILKKELPTLPSKYRFLLTSRPEGAIVSFPSLPTIYSVSLDNNSQDSKDDVRIFINSELERFQEDGGLKVPSNWPWDDNIEKLSKAADGLFIWASTALKFIFEGMNNWLLYLEELINNPKALNLNELYETVLNTSLKWDEHTKKIFPAVFSLILFGIRPLTNTEIDGILGLREGTTESLLSRLQSLVLYESNRPIRVHHASFHDYLVSCKGMNWYINVDTQKEYIAAKCFERMGKLLRFNICDLESSFIFNKDVHDLEDRIRKNIPSYLQYICCNWIRHLKEVSFSQLLCEKMRSFLYNHLLYWLEVLSLTGTFNDCVGSVLLCSISWLENKDAGLTAFLRDTYRQVSTFATPISQSTPHIYTSLLPLMKDESIVATYYAEYANPASRAAFYGEKPRVAFIKEIARNNGNWFHCASYCPDGSRIVSGLNDGRVSIWDAASGKTVLGPLDGHSGMVLSVAASPNGKYIASGSSDKTIRVWSAESGELLQGPFEGHTGAVISISFSPNSTFIASGSRDETVRIWDVETGGLNENTCKGHFGEVLSVSISSDSLCLASGSVDKSVIVWDVERKTMKMEPLRGHSDTVKSVVFSPNGSNIVSGSGDGTILVWNVSNGAIVASYPKCDTIDGITSVAYSLDGMYILSGYDDGLIRSWNATDSTMPPKQFIGHKNSVMSITLSPDGTRFVSSSLDKVTRVWDISGGKVVESFEGQSFIKTAALSCTGRYIASGSNDYTVCVWDTSSGELVSGPWKGHKNWIASVAFSPNEEFVASCSNDNTIRIWSMVQEECATITGHTEPVQSVVFSPDGENIASASRDKTIRVWSIRRKELVVGPFVGHEGWVNTIAYSPDSMKIVSGSDDQTIRIWDASNGQALNTLHLDFEYVNSVAFSLDGTRIISGSGTFYSKHDTGTVKVWDAESGKLICCPVTDRFSCIYSVCISADGKRILSGSGDGIIRMWDTLSGDLLATFTGHLKLINSVCFFPNGRQFASASHDGTIRIWTLDDKPDDIEWQLRNVDGWVIGENDELLMWLPPEVRDTHFTPGTIAVLNRSYITKLDVTRCLIGNEWTRIRSN